MKNNNTGGTLLLQKDIHDLTSNIRDLSDYLEELESFLLGCTDPVARHAIQEAIKTIMEVRDRRLKTLREKQQQLHQLILERVKAGRPQTLTSTENNYKP